MTKLPKYLGGCLCGKARFEVEGKPSLVGICHCRYCQLRTGSAFGVSVYFPIGNVKLISGDLHNYRFETSTGNHVDFERCRNCGTTLFWETTAKRLSGLKGTAGGTYDPPTFWYSPEEQVFVRSKADFCTVDVPKSYSASVVPADRATEESRLTGGFEV